MEKKKRNPGPRIEDPFIQHEGHWYLLPDWYSRGCRHGRVLTLYPLNKMEKNKLLYLRESHWQEAYAFVVPMMQRRGLVVDPGNDE